MLETVLIISLNTLIVQEGKLLLGEMGRVYFVDWDQLRERTRTINLMIMGE
ncbi:hypothetical protein EfmAA290_31750 (plasmid) [Enterococcus faecium]|nr:hypothetical protein EfmAA290_31750 [Enterococcus faecium]